MLNFIFQQRNTYGMSARKINNLLDQEGGCTLEQLLTEDEFVIQQAKQANTKLIDFLTQKNNLRQLIEYSTLKPSDESHEVAHKFPFVAQEILCSCKSIATAIIAGGYDEQTQEPEDEDESAEHPFVRELTEHNNKVKVSVPAQFLLSE
jgi:hypothetical protein